MSAIASVERIREHFPALNRRQNGYPVAYFDGPGGTQTPRVVADAVCDYLLNHNANTHWAFPSSLETDAALRVLEQLGCDFAQGYHIARPMPADKIAAWASERAALGAAT